MAGGGAARLAALKEDHARALEQLTAQADEREKSTLKALSKRLAHQRAQRTEQLQGQGLALAAAEAQAVSDLSADELAAEANASAELRQERTKALLAEEARHARALMDAGALGADARVRSAELRVLHAEQTARLEGELAGQGKHATKSLGKRLAKRRAQHAEQLQQQGMDPAQAEAHAASDLAGEEQAALDRLEEQLQQERAQALQAEEVQQQREQQEAAAAASADKGGEERLAALKGDHARALEQLTAEAEEREKISAKALAKRLANKRAQLAEQLQGQGFSLADAETRATADLAAEELAAEAETAAELRRERTEALLAEEARHARALIDTGALGSDVGARSAMLRSLHDEQMAQLEGELHGQEKRATKSLGKRLAKRRAQHAEQLQQQGMDPAQAEAHAASDLAAEEQAALDQLTEQLQQERAQALQAEEQRQQRALEAAAAAGAGAGKDREERLAALKGDHARALELLEAEAEEREKKSAKALAKRLAKKHAQLAEDLQRQGLSPADAEASASADLAAEELAAEELAAEAQAAAELRCERTQALLAEETRHERALREAGGLGEDAEGRSAALRALHDEQLARLERELDGQAKRATKSLGKRLAKRRAQHAEQLQQQGIDPAQAEAHAASDLAAEEQAALDRLEEQLRQERAQALQAEQQRQQQDTATTLTAPAKQGGRRRTAEHQADLLRQLQENEAHRAALRDMHAKQMALLEAEAAGRAQRAASALHKRLAAKQVRRAEELRRQGMDPAQAEAQAAAELAGEEQRASAQLAEELSARAERERHEEDARHEKVLSALPAIVGAQEAERLKGDQARLQQEEARRTDLRDMYNKQMALLGKEVAAKGQSATSALKKRLAGRRAKLAAELQREGVSRADAEARAENELAEEEQHAAEELNEQLLREADQAFGAEEARQAEVLAAEGPVDLDGEASRLQWDLQADKLKQLEADEAQRPKLKDMHHKQMALLQSEISAKEQMATGSLKRRLAKKHAQRAEELQGQGVGSAEAEAQAATELAAEEQRAAAQLAKQMARERAQALRAEQERQEEALVVGAAAALEAEGRLLQQRQNAQLQQLEADEAQRAKLKDMHAKQMTLLESEMASQGQRAASCLNKRLAAQKAKRAAELRQEGFSQAEAEAHAAVELGEEEQRARAELAERMLEEKERALRAEQGRQAEALAGEAHVDLAAEAERLREEHRAKLLRLQRSMEEDMALQVAALEQSMRAQRRAREAEMRRTLVDEEQARQVLEGMAALEKLEKEALQERLEVEMAREAVAEQLTALKVEVAGAEDPAELTAAAIREMHIKHTARLEAELKAKGRTSSKALEEKLQAKRLRREAELREQGLQAAEAQAQAARELADREAAERRELAERLRAEREQALQEDRRREAEALARGDMQKAEAARLRREHEQKSREAQEELDQQAKKRREALEAKLAAKRRAREVDLRVENLSEDEARAALAQLDAEETADRAHLEKELEAALSRKAREADVFTKDLQATQDKWQAAAVEAAARGAAPGGAPTQGAADVLELKALHEREMAMLMAQLGDLQREAAMRLKEDHKAKAAALEAQMEAEGVDAKSSKAAAMSSRLHSQCEREAQELHERMEQRREETLAEETARQAAVVAAGVDPQVELARLREKHAQALAVLQADMERHRIRQQQLLADRMSKKKQAKEAALQKESATDEEIAAALDALNAEEARDVKELELLLGQAEAASLAAHKQRQAYALGEQTDPDVALAELRAQHQKGELALRESLMAQAAARKARLKMRTAARLAARVREMAAQGKPSEQIDSAKEAIEAAAEQEEALLAEVMAKEAQARIKDAKDQAQAEQDALEAKQQQAHGLRSRHEHDLSELQRSLEEDKRRQQQALQARLKQKRQDKRRQLDQENASPDQVEEELASMEQAEARELKRLEEETARRHQDMLQEERTRLSEQLGRAQAAEMAALELQRQAQLELQKLRKEHEERQQALADALDDRRAGKERELADNFQRDREAQLAGCSSDEERLQREEQLDAEYAQALQRAQEEAIRDARREMEEELVRVARMKAAARAASEAAQADAAGKSRSIREEHEARVRELQAALEQKQREQKGRLQERLDKKRRQEEERLRSQAADQQAVQAALAKLEAEERAEVAALEQQMQQERKRMAEEHARKVAEQERLEQEERAARAEAEAAAAAKARAEAEAHLKKLQDEHEAQSKALDAEMQGERRNKEAKLKDRLAKKRKARESEIVKAALSQEEAAAQRARIAEEERQERDQALRQLAEEEDRRKAEQRARQEAAQRRANEEADLAAEEEAAAESRARAAEASREARERAQREEDERRAKKITQEMRSNEQALQKARQSEAAAKKSKLTDRLAKKKATNKAEAEAREAKAEELRARQEAERQQLLADQRARHEDHKSVSGSQGPVPGELSWEEAVRAAMAEPVGAGETEAAREKRVMHQVLASGLVPDEKIADCVEMVLSERHARETADLLTSQYRERAAKLAESLKGLLEAKNAARRAALKSLAHAGATEEERAEAMAQVDEDFMARQRQLEQDVSQTMEPKHMQGQLGLRQRQLREVASALKQMAPEEAVKKMHKINAEQAEQEMEEYRQAMEREKQERLRRVQEETAKFEEDLRKRHGQELARLQAEQDRILERERQQQEASLKEKEQALLAQQAEAQRKMEAKSANLDVAAKEQLLAQFKEEASRAMAGLAQESKASHSKLEDKLRARRDKKAKELEQQARREVQQKGKQALQMVENLERQTEQAAAMEQRAMAEAKAGEAPVTGRRASTTEESAAARFALQQLATKHREALVQTGGPQVTLQPPIDPAPALAVERHHQWMQKKLDSIETLIGALQAAQAEQAAAALKLREDVELRHRLEQQARTEQQERAQAERKPEWPMQLHYRDAEDEAMSPKGEQLELMPKAQLPVQALSRLEFADHLLSVLGMGSSIKIEVARNLPPNGDLNNTNAFRNSYMWEPSTGVLYVHARRLSSSGDFGLVLVHAVAHIKVNPRDLSNDLDPNFTRHFHNALKILTQELFKRRTGPPRPVSGGGAVGSPLQIQVPMLGPMEGVSSPMSPFVGLGSDSRPQLQPQAFTDRALGERIKAYATASNHPQLSEFLARYSQEQRNKFELSDDDASMSGDENTEAVSRVGEDDSAYMGEYKDDSDGHADDM